MENENKPNSRRTIYILVILLGVSLIGNIIQLNKTTSVQGELAVEKSNVDSLTSFKKQLENQFESMTFELDQFKGKNIELDSLLERANTDIARQKGKIDKLIKENKDIALLKRQLEEMKAIRDQYRVQIETLIKENKELRYANVNLTQEVDNLTKSKNDLSQKVELASVLKAENITVKTLRERGKGKFEPTNKAKRVNRIETVFVVAENKVAKPGKRELVLRIIKPDGYPLADANNGPGSFTKEDGRNTDYTLSKTLDYNNNREEVVFECNLSEDLRSGLYIAEIYMDGKLMGVNKFDLK